MFIALISVKTALKLVLNKLLKTLFINSFFICFESFVPNTIASVFFKESSQHLIMSSLEAFKLSKNTIVFIFN